MSVHLVTVQAYSDELLDSILNDTAVAYQWPDRYQAALQERQRRNRLRRGKEGA